MIIFSPARNARTPDAPNRGENVRLAPARCANTASREAGRGTYSLGSRDSQGAAGGEPPRSTGWGGIFTTEHPLTNRERLAAWRWRQRLKPARANKQPDRLSGWEIVSDLIAVLAFTLVFAVGLAAMWALQSVSDANAAEERCFQAALSEHNYCRSQADWGDQ